MNSTKYHFVVTLEFYDHDGYDHESVFEDDFYDEIITAYEWFRLYCDNCNDPEDLFCHPDEEYIIIKCSVWDNDADMSIDDPIATSEYILDREGDAAENEE